MYSAGGLAAAPLDAEGAAPPRPASVGACPWHRPCPDPLAVPVERNQLPGGQGQGRGHRHGRHPYARPPAPRRDRGRVLRRRVAVRQARPLRPHLVHRHGLAQRAQPHVHRIVDQRVPHTAPADDLGQGGPGRRVLRHARLDQSRQPRLHPGHVDRLVHRPVAHARRGTRTERRPPGRRVRQRRTQREDVRGGPRLVPEQHLGRGVARGSRGLAVLGEGRLAHAARDAEVDELRALRAQDDVLRLEVPVRHPVRVDARQALRQRREQPAAGVRGQTPRSATA